MILIEAVPFFVRSLFTNVRSIIFIVNRGRGIGLKTYYNEIGSRVNRSMNGFFEARKKKKKENIRGFAKAIAAYNPLSFCQKRNTFVHRPSATNFKAREHVSDVSVPAFANLSRAHNFAVIFYIRGKGKYALRVLVNCTI